MKTLISYKRYAVCNDKKYYQKNWHTKPKTLGYCKQQITAGNANGYGIITGEIEDVGILAIDIDGAEAEPLLTSICPTLLPEGTMAWSSGKTGHYQLAFIIPTPHLPFWSDVQKHDIKPVGSINDHHLELRYNNHASVLPPSAHPETGKYEWLNEVDPRLLSYDESYALLNHCTIAINSDLTSDQELNLITEALSYIPSDDYHTWVTVGMALYRQGCDFTLWDNWSMSSKKYDSKGMDKKWASFGKASRVNIGTLFHLAQQHGFDQKRWMKEHLKRTRQALNHTVNVTANNQAVKDTNELISLTNQLIERLANPSMAEDERDREILTFCHQYHVSDNPIRKAVQSKLERIYEEAERENIGDLVDDIINTPRKRLDLRWLIGDFMAEVIEQQAKALPTNPDALFMSLLPIYASLIGTRANVMVNKKSNFVVPFIVRLCLVAESGKGKTPCIKQATQPLNELHAMLRKLYEEEKQQWEAMTNEEKADNPKPHQHHVIVKDITFEGLFKALQHNNGACLLNRDELAGYYNGLTNYGRGGGDAVQRDLELYQGDSIQLTRADSERDIYVPRTAVSFLGGMQPVMANELISRKTDDAGVSVRLTWFCGEFPEHMLTPRDDEDNTFYEINKLLTDGLFHKNDYQQLKVDDGGYQVLMDWYNGIIVPRRIERLLDKEKSKHSKILEEAVKYAGLLHYIYMFIHPEMITNENAINAQTMERGIHIAELMLTHYLYLVQQSNEDNIPSHYAKILRLLTARGEITAGEAYLNNKSQWVKQGWKTNDVAKLLLDLVVMGKATRVETKKGVKIRAV